MTEHYIPLPTANITGTNWLARCVCGWVGTSQPSRAKAQNEGDDHVTYMTALEVGQ